MKTSPLSFMPAMTRAWYEDRKTNTRRIVKPQPADALIANGSADGMYVAWPTGNACLEWADVVADPAYYAQAGYCPYGGPGDRVWIRETLVRDAELNAVRYECDGGHVNPAGVTEWPWKVNKLAPRFMPRWACRSYGEIVAVNVERVQDITPRAIVAEGIYHEPGAWGADSEYPHLFASFAALWDQINAARGYGWQVNPWVWVLTLKRLTT